MPCYLHAHSVDVKARKWDVSTKVRTNQTLPTTITREHTVSYGRQSSAEHNRAEVARGSIGAVVHVAKLMADDPVLACAVSAAVYNFVSRQGGSTLSSNSTMGVFHLFRSLAYMFE